MFSQPPEKEPYNSLQKQKSTRKKRKKQNQKNKKKEASQVKQSLANSMSAWAENYTMAATWQLKHQVAVWKSRATALEYENQILRETLRRFYVSCGTNVSTTGFGRKASNLCNTNTHYMDYEESYTEREPSASSRREDSDAGSSDQKDEEEESELELEISEEYMAFLRENFEFRKAREERKKKEADEEKRKENEALANPMPSKDRTEEFKELYGVSWQRVAALDSYLSSQFVSLCDSEKPGYWPNIPLRF